MEEQGQQTETNVVETQDTSVTETSQAPNQETSQTESTETPAGEEEGRIPMSRWNQKLKVERELRASVQKYEQDFQKYQKAIEFHEALSADPSKLEQIMKIMQAKEEAQNNYEQFDPDVAERFRKLDSLEKWKADLERKEQAREAQGLQSHKQGLEDEFSGLLKQDGYLKQDGSYNEKTVNVIAKATLATLLDIAKNPDAPTKQELSDAYKTVTEGLSALNKSSLTKLVSPNVPLSGSKSGTPMKTGGGKMTDAQRQADILAMLG